MEKAGNGQSAPALKKGKKKQAKGELDRLKQAEKRKRRLEKALANSAAIRSELEMKKQKKKEQQRLDEEGAAIAEAVALHVLVGEDAEDSCHFMVNRNRIYNPWRNSSGNIGVFTGYQSLARHSVEHGWGHGSGCKWNNWDIGQSLPRGVHAMELQSPIFERSYQGVELSAGLIAAQAVSSLQIAEKSQENLFSGQGAATVVIDRMLGGNNMVDGLDLYREY